MAKTLNELLQEHFGVKTSFNENPEVDTVAITVTKIFAYNPNRLGFVVINTGTNPIYVAYKNDVAVNAGIMLVAGGGVMSAIWNEDFELCSMELFAIASGGVSTIYSVETVSI